MSTHSQTMYSVSRQGRLRPLLVASCILVSSLQVMGQIAAQPTRMIVPLRSFVSVSPIAGAGSQKSAVTTAKPDLASLTVYFDRSSLPPEAGPQFVRITTHVLNRDGDQLDAVDQFAFTFPREETPEKDADKMEEYARQIMQFGFISPGRSDSVQIRLDTLPDWGYVRIVVAPDEEYTKYTSRNNTRIIWHYRIRGSWLDSRFTFGIPKVIYDSQATDSVEYGNASALLRFFYVDRESGEQFPVSAGFGLYGVSTPLDVSKRGGGFVLSLYFDVIQFFRIYGLEITDRANAGLEIAPFFPVEKKPRVLLSARIGYNP